MANDYTSQWFDVFLDSIPSEWTDAEVAGVARCLPLPDHTRVLDVCCGPGRHASHLIDQGFEVTGIDRDGEAITEARRVAPNGSFHEMDQREIGSLAAEFDAAVILWQSFGFFDAETNDRVLRSIGGLLRTGGRLLLDMFNPAYFERRQGRMTDTRDPRCAAITNRLLDLRLTSTIEYVDGEVESMEWELFDPDQLVARSASAGFTEVERCAWWEQGRTPSPDDQRYQLVLQKG